MPFLAPVIATAIGVGAVGQAIIGAGLSLGAAYLARRLQPKPETGARGMSLSLRLETNESRQIAFGRVATDGSLKYHNTYGAHNKFVQLVYVLADHECDALETVYVDGVEVTLGSDVTLSDVTGQTVSQFANVMWIKFHSGAWSQAADADLVAKAQSGHPWPTDNRGRGVCFVRVTLKYDAKKFPNGMPRFRFVIRGAKLYDWREDSTAGGSGSQRWGTESTYAWTDNPVVQLYNYRRGIFVNGNRLGGMNTPAAAMPLDDWTAAANACEETVSLKAGGSEARYRCNGFADVSSDHTTIIRDILASMAGEEVDSGGVLRPLAGVARSSVATITDADLIFGDMIEITPKQSQASLVNAVFGTYQEPASLYEATALPPRISTDDADADGGAQLDEHYNLAFVTSGTQGQRVTEILRRRSRQQRTVSCRLRSKFAALEAGDWVTWSSSRYGWTSATFEVEQAVLERDLTVSVVLRQTAASVYAWTPATDELDPENPQPVASGGSTFTTVQDFALAHVTIDSGGAATRPGLRATWTAPEDPTIIALRIVYRRQGDTVEIPVPQVLDPDDGAYTWITGVQGGTIYEARVLPVVRPERAVSWSGWASTASATSSQVVDVGAIEVAPDTITADMLAPLERFELSLVAAGEQIQGSVNERLQTVSAQIATIADTAQRLRQSITSVGGHVQTVATEAASADFALAEQINSVTARLDTGDIASFIETITSRVGTVEDVAGGRNRTFHQADAPIATAVGDLWVQTDEGNTLYVATEVGTAGWVYAGDGRITSSASQLVTITTRVGDLEGETFDLNQSIGGVLAQRVIGVDVNGHAAVVQINGTSLGSNITFSAEGFHFTDPRINGGEGFSLIVPEQVGGVWQAFLDADLIVRSITSGSAVFGSLQAISSNFGDMTCTGQQRSASGKMVTDWSNDMSWIDA